MTWTTPKVDYAPGDGITEDDFNKMNANDQYLYDNLDDTVLIQDTIVKRFQIDANNANAVGTYVLKVKGGITYSTPAAADDGVINFNGLNITKLLSATPWAAGTGSTSPCLAPGATFGNDKWFFVFALQKPGTSTVDICLDDDIDGGNIAGSTIETSAGYTLWHRIGALKTSTLLAANGIIPTTARHQKFIQSGALAARQCSKALSTTPALTTLQDSNSISLLPDDGVATTTDFPCFLEIECASFTVDYVNLWNPQFGSTYYSGIGIDMNMYTNAGDKLINHVDYLPDFNQVYLRSSSGTPTVDIKLISYIDDCSYR